MIPDKRTSSTFKSDSSCSSKTCKPMKLKQKNNRTSLNSSVKRQKPLKNSNLQNQVIKESEAEHKPLESGNNIIEESNNNNNRIINSFPIPKYLMVSGYEDKNEDNVPLITQENNEAKTSIRGTNDENKVDTFSILVNDGVNENDEETFIAQTNMAKIESIVDQQNKFIGTKSADFVSDDTEPSNVPCQKPTCRGPICDRSQVKLKLEESDAPSDFLLVEGPVYIRKSLVENAKQDSKNIDGADEPPKATLKEDSIVGLQGCKKCCGELNFCTKDQFKGCHSDTEAIINAYKSKYERQVENEDLLIKQESSEDLNKFYLQMTHGEADGDDKYHYLMVDTTTSYSSNDYQNIEKQPSIKPSKSSAVPLPLSTPSLLAEKKSALSSTIFRSNISKPQNESQISQDKSYVNVEKDESSLAELHQGGMASSSDSATKEAESGGVPQETTIDLDSIKPSEVPGEGRRISIIWDQAIGVTEFPKPIRQDQPVTDEPQTEPSEQASRERRVSAISWRSLDADPLNAAAVGPSDSLQRIADESTRRSEHFQRSAQLSAGRQNSIFQNIVRAEKRKSISKKAIPTFPDDYLKKSIVDSRIPLIPPKKAKCCGLIKAKHRHDKTANPEDPDIDNDVNDDETSNNNDSNRSSINSYRRRSSPVENPVSEKHKEINHYLNNV